MPIRRNIVAMQLSTDIGAYSFQCLRQLPINGACCKHMKIDITAISSTGCTRTETARSSQIGQSRQGLRSCRVAVDR